MSRILGVVYAVLALAATTYFVYAVFDALFGDYVGGEVATVWVITGVAGLITALLWWAAVYQFRKSRIAEPNIPATEPKDALTHK
jgi:hypothetical protein